MIEILTDHDNLHQIMKSSHKLLQRHVRWALVLSAYNFHMMYCKRTMNSVDGPLQRANYWQEVKAENATMEHCSTLEEILFPTAMTVTENKQSADVSCKVHIQTCTQVRQLLSADCADQKNKDHRRQACEAAMKEAIYEDVSKILLESLSEYLQIDPLANKVTQSLKAAEAPGEGSQYLN